MDRVFFFFESPAIFHYFSLTNAIMLRIINPMYSWKIQIDPVCMYCVYACICVRLHMEFGEWCMISKLDFHFLPLGISFSHFFLSFICLLGLHMVYGVSDNQSMKINYHLFSLNFRKFSTFFFHQFIYLYIFECSVCMGCISFNAEVVSALDSFELWIDWWSSIYCLRINTEQWTHNPKPKCLFHLGWLWISRRAKRKTNSSN